MGELNDLDELPPHLTFEIAHFFDVYKDLEPDKLTKVGGFDGVEAAWEEIERSFERARQLEALEGSAWLRDLLPEERTLGLGCRANSSSVSEPASWSVASCWSRAMMSSPAGAAEAGAGGGGAAGADGGWPWACAPWSAMALLVPALAPM